jgi:hypothetical protein
VEEIATTLVAETECQICLLAELTAGTSAEIVHPHYRLVAGIVVIGNTIHNIVGVHPIATVQPQTGLGARHAATPWPTGNPVLGNRSVVREAI